jgi:hypothetical protein
MAEIRIASKQQNAAWFTNRRRHFLDLLPGYHPFDWYSPEKHLADPGQSDVWTYITHLVQNLRFLPVCYQI